MTLATRLALLEAQTKADRTAEDAIRRTRFKDAKGNKPGGNEPTAIYRFSDYLKPIGASADTGLTAYRSSGNNPVFRAYRELKILHD